MSEAASYDYIVVGSGAGGGPLAANLAEAGFSTLLLEAGGEHEDLAYQVPCFHGLASEDPDMRWDYFVRHYASEDQQRRDSKFVADRDGVLYPRSGTLGGCTAHNAMITVYPGNQDWDDIAELTGDASWRSEGMRGYFERLERCRYRCRGLPLPPGGRLAGLLRSTPLLRDLFGNPSRHGFCGWLPVSAAKPKLALGDWEVVDMVLAAAQETLAEHIGRPLTRLESLEGYFDPNDWRAVTSSIQGLWRTPVSTDGVRRHGARERIRAVERSHSTLTVQSGALAAAVLFDGDRAAGVRYLRGEHLYRADPRAASAANPVECEATARREVILSGGAFNTPQLLKLSGIGPRAELERHGIAVRVDLPGVGENLQDRYEVGVVSRLRRDLALLGRCSFAPPQPGARPDPCLSEWRTGKGVYTTNGVVVSIVLKSDPAHDQPDLFVFGLPASFRGYYPGYSEVLERGRRSFTWAILKAHTRNKAGSVRLRSADPRDVPLVDFHYFEEGDDSTGYDLDSVVAGVQFVRRLMARASGITEAEVVPGSEVQTSDQIREFVRNEAWGHHASCSCRIGHPGDRMAVIDSEFRVRGVRNLRIVDASVFPRIPGFFIVSAVYMVSEKASDVILSAAGARPARRR
ncbi:MAG: glucose-methanol-choline oxidoreductase [Chloroflexi bacterium]|nr:MAG: glucose-methanol-choline oxidoreductase [Chloroflexota bacterium]